MSKSGPHARKYLDYLVQLFLSVPCWHLLGLACLCLPVQLQLWLLIHSFNTLFGQFSCTSAFHGPKNIFIRFFIYSPSPYPTLPLPPVILFVCLFVCLSCELLCYTRSVTQIPVFVVENDTSITFVFFPKFMKSLFTTINDLSTEWVWFQFSRISFLL